MSKHLIVFDIIRGEAGKRVVNVEINTYYGTGISFIVIFAYCH